MYTVRNPYSLRPNQTSASDVVKNQKRLANKRAAYPYGELPKGQLSPQQFRQYIMEARMAEDRSSYTLQLHSVLFCHKK